MLIKGDFEWSTRFELKEENDDKGENRPSVRSFVSFVRPCRSHYPSNIQSDLKEKRQTSCLFRRSLWSPILFGMECEFSTRLSNLYSSNMITEYQKLKNEIRRWIDRVCLSITLIDRQNLVEGSSIDGMFHVRLDRQPITSNSFLLAGGIRHVLQKKRVDRRTRTASFYFSNAFVDETADDVNLLFVHFGENFLSVRTEIDESFFRIQLIDRLIVEQDRILIESGVHPSTFFRQKTFLRPIWEEKPNGLARSTVRTVAPADLSRHTGDFLRERSGNGTRGGTDELTLFDIDWLYAQSIQINGVVSCWLTVSKRSFAWRRSTLLIVDAAAAAEDAGFFFFRWSFRCSRSFSRRSRFFTLRGKRFTLGGSPSPSSIPWSILKRFVVAFQHHHPFQVNDHPSFSYWSTCRARKDVTALRSRSRSRIYSFFMIECRKLVSADATAVHVLYVLDPYRPLLLRHECHYHQHHRQIVVILNVSFQARGDLMEYH